MKRRKLLKILGLSDVAAQTAALGPKSELDKIVVQDEFNFVTTEENRYEFPGGNDKSQELVDSLEEMSKAGSRGNRAGKMLSGKIIEDNEYLTTIVFS